MGLWAPLFGKISFEIMPFWEAQGAVPPPPPIYQKRQPLSVLFPDFGIFGFERKIFSFGNEKFSTNETNS
jgi:hypothetical protein